MIEARESPPGKGLRRGPFTFALLSFYIIGALVVAAWNYIFIGGDGGFTDLFEGRTWENAGDFILQLAGLRSEDTPAFLEPAKWWASGKLAYNTLGDECVGHGHRWAGRLCHLHAGGPQRLRRRPGYSSFHCRHHCLRRAADLLRLYPSRTGIGLGDADNFLSVARYFARRAGPWHS